MDSLVKPEKDDAYFHSLQVAQPAMINYLRIRISGN
jgi:hypothetical protein